MTRGLSSPERRWFVEVTFDVSGAGPDDDATTQLRIELYSEEWGFWFRRDGKISWVRVTDVPFVHGRDEHGLLRDTPALNNLSQLVRALEDRFEIQFDRSAPLIRTTCSARSKRSATGSRPGLRKPQSLRPSESRRSPSRCARGPAHGSTPRAGATQSHYKFLRVHSGSCVRELQRVRTVAESWMLGRLSRETKRHHHVADNDRLAVLGAADPALYTRFLKRIYGFEAPVEAALLMTPRLEDWIDFRDRGHVRLLRADLRSLGVSDPTVLVRCSTISPFRQPAEALGWTYAVERNRMLHGVLDRHLRGRMPAVIGAAGSYLAGQQRSNALCMRELGTAMDRIAKDSTVVERIVAAAKAAFRTQHAWYDVAIPQPSRVA